MWTSANVAGACHVFRFPTKRRWPLSAARERERGRARGVTECRDLVVAGVSILCNLSIDRSMMHSNLRPPPNARGVEEDDATETTAAAAGGGGGEGRRGPADDDHNSLELTIISAQGLRDVRMFGKMSPYALVWIDPEDKHCTHVAHNAGCNPAWDYKMYLPLPQSLKNAELTVQIFSRGSGKDDPLLGSTDIPLGDLSGGLQYMACQLQRASGRIHGLLNVSMQTCHSDREALESSTFKRILEVSGSFRNYSSDDDQEEEQDPREGHDQMMSHQMRLQLRLDHGHEGSASSAAASCASTPAARPRRTSAVLTAPDILDFGEVEDPSAERPERPPRYPGGQQHDAANPQQRERPPRYQGPGNISDGSGSSGGGGHHQGGGDATGVDLGGGGVEGGTIGTYYLGSQASAAMDHLAGH